MNDATRRNRNEGTKKRGFKTQSKFKIPSSWYDSRSFYEKLTKFRKVTRQVNDQSITFIVEETRKNSCHACTIEDIETILSNIPAQYYAGLTTFVLRQPKAKEQILSSVWGRLIYLYEFGGESFPAVILESVDYSKNMTWGRKLNLEDQKELGRLKEDGYGIEENSRGYNIILSVEHVRNTQLYRTLLHEIGHYYHYITTKPEIYEHLSSAEREVYTHNFADKLKIELQQKGKIPFDRILNKENISLSGLNITDFDLS